jgi:hypothetical protein
MARIDNHCPHCGEDNGAKGDFCPRCGARYTDPITNPDEAKRINDEARKSIRDPDLNQDSPPAPTAATTNTTTNQNGKKEKPANMKKNWILWLIIAILAILLAVLFFNNYSVVNKMVPIVATTAASTVAPTATAIATLEPTVAPTATPVATLTPTTTPEPTPSPTATITPVPTVSVPTTPAIFAKIGDKNFGDQGEHLDTVLGKRITFTNRKVIVPAKAWNQTLSKAELKLVETTWVNMIVDVPQGMLAVVFAGGVEQGINLYNNGVLITLTPGHYEFKLRNGEIVIWYPNQGTYQKNDLARIISQIKNGNFDIKSELSFFGVTTDLFSQIPDDLVRKDKIQIINDLDITSLD